VSSTATAEAPADQAAVSEDSPNGEALDAAKLMPNAVNGMELRMVSLDDIIIPPDRHQRREKNRSGVVRASVDAIGLDSPLLLSPIGNGKYWLVAGGGRLEDAREKGEKEIHGLVKIRDEKGRAASTAAENIAREGLSPAEEADAIELMIKAGDSPREAAEKVGLTAHTGTLRMPLVEMPEEIRGAFHWGGLSPKVASTVKEFYDGNWEVGLEIGALGHKIPDDVMRAFQRGAAELFRELPCLHQRAKLRGKAPFIATLHRGSDHGRSLRWHPQDPARIKLKGKAAKWFTELSSQAKYNHERPDIVLSEEDLDQAVAIGVAYHSEGEHGSVWVHDRKWLTDHINEFVLPRMKTDSETKAKETPLAKLKKAVKGKVELAKMTASELAPTLERKFKRELQPKAHAANLDLGRKLTTKLAVGKLTRQQALFFAYEVLGAENNEGAYLRSYDRGARRIAECAARVMEEWVTVETRQLKSGKTKTTVTYLEGDAAEKRMWEYIKGARTPEEILQRALHMYGAAMTFRRECGANGREPQNQEPMNATAREALAKIVKPFIPSSVDRLVTEIEEYKPTKEAETIIKDAKAEAAKKDAPASGEPAKAKASRSTRGKGSATRAAETLAIVTEQPGVTIPELAAKMGVKQNYLYRVLPALERDGKVTKQGRGWHPVKDAAAPAFNPLVLVTQTGGKKAKKARLQPDAAPAGRKVRKVVFLDSKRSAWVAEGRITAAEDEQTAQAA
jgi:ParB/RepB/Spo0J family partition protein